MGSQDLNLCCFSHALTPIPAGAEPAQHLKEMLLTTPFGSKQNFSDYFIAPCLPSPLSLPGARHDKVLGYPLLLEAGE